MSVKFFSEWYAFQTAKEGDVGHDLYALIDVKDMTRTDRLVHRALARVNRWVGLPRPLNLQVIWPFTSRVVRSGVKIDLPPDLWVMIHGRSSAMKRNLFVVGGIIDSGYRGEYFTVLRNLGLVPRIVKDQERYSQAIFFNAVRPQLSYVAESKLSETSRGATGFGSTGGI